MVFLKTNDEEHKEYFLSSFELIQGVYGKNKVRFGLEKLLDEEEIVFSFVEDFEDLCECSSNWLINSSFGFSKGYEVYLKELILKPSELIPEKLQLKYLGRLINQEDIEHIINVTSMHEFQETVVGNHEDFIGSIPHILLSHFDEVHCIDNYELVQAEELDYLQRKYLSSINRMETPCERHFKLVDYCLTN